MPYDEFAGHRIAIVQSNHRLENTIVEWEMNMNFIFNNSNTSIGGIEVLFIEMAKYLSKNNHNVYFISNHKDDVYIRYLNHLNNIFFVNKKINKLVEYCSDNDITTEKENMLSKFKDDDNYYVMCPYYESLQYAIAIFGKDSRFKLIHLWAHPQSWCKELVIIKKNGFITKKIKNSKYYYQKKLLKYLGKNRADFYPSEVVTTFNNWYYEIDLNPDKFESFPIDNVNVCPKDSIVTQNEKNFNILWCGRFDYFKNEAIIHIHKVLEQVADRYPDYNISYSIIGFGSKKDTKYVKENIKSLNVEVEFIDRIEPSDLALNFKKYDIGIGMGLTVKKMAQVGLPSIVIDSFERRNNYSQNSNWLYDTIKGDAGDGYYCKMAERPIDSRKTLIDLLDDVFKNPQNLSVHSQKCLSYVNEYYSFEKQTKAIIDTAIESKFAGSSYPIYRKNRFLRFAYSIFEIFRNIIKSSN